MGEQWRYNSIHFLASMLDGVQWSNSRPGRSTPRERTLGTHSIGVWVAYIDGLDDFENRPLSCTWQDSKSEPSSS